MRTGRRLESFNKIPKHCLNNETFHQQAKHGNRVFFNKVTVAENDKFRFY